MTNEEFELLFEEADDLSGKLNKKYQNRRFYAIVYDADRRKYGVSLELFNKKASGVFNVNKINKYANLLDTDRIYVDSQGIIFHKEMPVKGIKDFFETELKIKE